MSGTVTDSRGVYGITIAAELVGAKEQTLRLYERRGLLAPARTAGGTRRYSNDDLEVLRRILAIVEDGVNLAGVRRIIALEAENDELRLRIAELAADSPES